MLHFEFVGILRSRAMRKRYVSEDVEYDVDDFGRNLVLEKSHAVLQEANEAIDSREEEETRECFGRTRLVVEIQQGHDAGRT